MIAKPYIAKWQEHAPWKDFSQNIEAKENDPDFTGDMEALLRTEITYNQQEAIDWLKEEIIEKI